LPTCRTTSGGKRRSATSTRRGGRRSGRDRPVLSRAGPRLRGRGARGGGARARPGVRPHLLLSRRRRPALRRGHREDRGRDARDRLRRGRRGRRDLAPHASHTVIDARWPARDARGGPGEAARAHALPHGPARAQHDRAARPRGLDHRRADRRRPVPDRFQARGAVRRAVRGARGQGERGARRQPPRARLRRDGRRVPRAPRSAPHARRRAADPRRAGARGRDRGLRRAGVRRHPRRHDGPGGTFRDRPHREQGPEQQATLRAARRPRGAGRGG
jgi:hypothetical protein